MHTTRPKLSVHCCSQGDAAHMSTPTQRGSTSPLFEVLFYTFRIKHEEKPGLFQSRSPINDPPLTLTAIDSCKLAKGFVRDPGAVYCANMVWYAIGLPTFRYTLAHHEPESLTAFPPGSRAKKTGSPSITSFHTSVTDTRAKPTSYYARF